MSFLVSFILRIRYWVWLAVLAGAAVLWWTTPPIVFEQSIEGFFPDDHPALVAYRKATALFGEDHFVFAAYDDPKLWTVEGMNRVRAFATALAKEVTGLKRIDALDQMPVPWKADEAVEALVKNPFAVGKLLGGLATVRKEVERLAKEPQQLAEFQRKICAHPLFYNLLVDRAGSMTSLVLHRDERDDNPSETVRKLREAADRFAKENGLARVAVVGPPVLVSDGFTSLEKDNRWLAIAGMVLMSATMLVALRSPGWALLPVVAGGMTWLITAAFISWFGLKLTLSSGPIIAQTAVLCMPAASHLALRYRQVRRQGLTGPEAARTSLEHTFTPVVWCALTAAVGYLAVWIVSTVLPVRQMGLTMFVTNLIAGALTFALAAGLMTDWRRSAPASLAGGERESASVGRLTSWVIAHPIPVLMLFALPCLVLAIGVFWLRLESNHVKVFRQSARVAQDYFFVEERMGGIGLVEIVFPAPEKVDAAWIEKLQDFSRQIVETDPHLVQGVISLADLLGFSYKSSAAADRLLEAKLTMLSMPGNVHFLDSVWNRKQNTMRLLVRIKEGAEAEQKEVVFERMLSLAKEQLSPDAYLTGLSHLMTRITQAVIVTASQAVIWTCLIVLVMLVLALRRPLLAMLALVPSLLAVGLVLGVMGWLDLKIDMATALVASVALGLAVDDSFHCLLRWQEEMRKQPDVNQALRTSYAGSGPGVILSSAAVSIGFLALAFSEFMPMVNFGWLVAVATLGGSIGNLVFVPAFIALWQRK